MSDPATLTSAVSPSVDEGPVAEPFGHPTDTFDVEPPYLPDAEAIAGVEKYEDRFIDREVSWVRFNQRVLELAEDPTLPLLERARFLAIFASNLDEFFMVRVAGLKRRIAAGVAVRAASGLMPREQLEMLWVEGRALMERHAQALVDLLPELGGHGIEIVRWAELDREEQKICKKLFKDRIFPVLTPLAVDPAHPFPYISGLSLNLAVVVRHPKTGTEHFARVKVPPTFGRFVRGRQPALRADRGRHRRAPQEALPRHGRAGLPHLPGHPQRGPRGRGGRRGEPPQGAREGAAAAPLRPAGAARGRGVDRPQGARAARLRARRQPRRGRLAARPARPDRPPLDRRPAARRPQVRRLPPVDAPEPGGGRVVVAGRRLRLRVAPRRAAAPPLRLLRHLGAALPRAGGRRPARAGDQADALPHLRRQPDHRGAHRRRRGRQAGAGDRGDQGPLRRAGQHPLGAQARAVRLPRRLRPRRPQDPLQAVDGRARRARGHPPLRPPRHRQLQPQDGTRSTRTSAC